MIDSVSKEYGKRRNKLLCKNSRAESHFAELLNKANIFYIQEKCCFNNKGNWFYIDFYLPKYRLAIEIDGKEHQQKSRLEKDIRKTFFLESERNIFTTRITNDECLGLKEISLIDILKRAGMKPIGSKDSLLKEKEWVNRELDRISKSYIFDTRKEIYIYDKTKDYTFSFKNLYNAKKSTGLKYKSIIENIKSCDVNYSPLYIISTDMDSLNALVNKYYDTFIKNQI